MSQIEKFWSVVENIYTAWDSNGSWGDYLIAIPGKPIDDGVQSAVSSLLDGLFEAFMAQTPFYLSKTGHFGIFVGLTSSAAVELITPFKESAPRTIGERTITFEIHPKNRKEPLVDAETFTTIIKDAKGLGMIYDDEYLQQYSREFTDAIKSFTKTNNINESIVNGPILKVLLAPPPPSKKSSSNDDGEKKSKKSRSNDDDNDGGDDADDVASALSERRERSRQQMTSQYTRERDREERNRVLIRENAEKALARLSADSSLLDQFKDPAQRVVTSYNHLNEMPSDQGPKLVYVDTPRDTVLFPINSQLVPIHVSLIKTVTKSEEGQFFILTVEFVTPTAKRTPPGSSVDHTFIRSLQYRSKGSTLMDTFTKIRQLQSDYKLKLKAAVSSSSLVEQPKLISMKNPTVVLRDVSSKPLISPAKGGIKGRATGTLTAHHNGLKYVVADKAQGAFTVDFIYSNIKSCYFKRADKQNANLILLHFEFHHPILVKKDKTSKFMQIYVELIEESFDTSRTNAMSDRDAEIMEEEQERKMAQQRRQWNEKFAQFAAGLESQWGANNPELQLEFELPSRATKFQGIVNKDQVDVYVSHTGQSIIALDATPVPFVVNLADVELASLERVGFGLREFDLLFVLKDFKAEPRMISSIPLTQIDTVRSFLADNRVLSGEFKININWKVLLEEVRADLLGFYQEGGWASLLDEDGDEDDEDDDDEDDEDEGDNDGGAKKKKSSRYDDSDSDFELSDEDSTDDEYSSDEDEDDDDSDSDSGSGSDSEGEDWSDLEEEADHDDRRRDAKRRDDSDDDRRSSKKDKKSSKR